MRSILVLAGALLWTNPVQAQIAPGQVITYPNGIGFINDDGVPEYRSFPRPPKNQPAPKKITRIPLGKNVVLYPHTIGYIDGNGVATLENIPPGFFDTVLGLLTEPLGYFALVAQRQQVAAAAGHGVRSVLTAGVAGVQAGAAIAENAYWIACPPTTLYVAAFGAPVDPGNSASQLGGLTNVALTVATDPSGNLMLQSPDSRFSGMKGTAQTTAAGTQYTFTDTRQVTAYPGTVVTVSFGLANSSPGQPPPQPTNLKVSILAPPDASVGATVWTATSTTIASNNVASCNNPGVGGDPVALDTGEFLSDPGPDLSLHGPLALEFRRHYGSLLKTNLITGAMADNWMHNYETRLGVSATTATVVLFGGATVQFTKSGNNWTPAQKQPYAYQLVQTGTNYQFLNPQVNLSFTYSATGALSSIQDRNGNTLTVTQSTQGPTLVADGLGRSLTFTYGATSNLTSVKDQTGRTVSFGYTGGALTTVIDANGKVTAYSYTSASGRTGLMATVKRPAGNLTVSQTFDTQGRVTRQADGLNNATTYTYNNPGIGSGLMTDPLGGKTQYDHNDLRNNTTLTDANGKTITTTFDAASHPVQITDALGNKTILAYDAASGLPSTLTDATGAVTTATYTSQTQAGFTYYLLSKLTYPDGASTSYTYDPSGNLLTVTDPAGKITQFTYDKTGALLTSKNPLGGVTTYTYNTDGTVATMQTPAGNVVQFSHDTLKRLSKLTYADGTSDSFAYDARDRVLSHTPAAGQAETFTYDDNGNPQTVTDTSGAVTTMSFDANDAPVAVKDGNGASSSVAYDAAARTSAITNGAGERTTITSDAAGQPLAMLDAAGNGRRFTWNANGFLQTLTDALSKSTAYTTDAVGRILTRTSPLNEKSTFAYDKAGRLLGVTSPLGHTLKFSYDAPGNVVRLDWPAGIGVAVTRNELGQATGVTDPNGGVWKNSFDSMGRLVSAADPLGQATTIQYDSRNRTTGATNSAGNVKVTRNALGKPTAAQFSDGLALSYQYGAGNHLTGADNLALDYNQTGDVVSSNGIATTRDGAHRITSVTYAPSLAVTYKYNNVGDLAEVDDWAGGATLFQYDAAHRMISMKRPNGATTTYTRDANGRVTGSAETTGDGPFSITLTRDAEGKVLSSNRTLPQAPQPAPGFNGYTYDAASQISGATYDILGRLTSDGFHSYTWDMASRLTSYSGPDGSASFTYDGLGMRVSRTTAAGEQDYVWNYAHAMPVMAAIRTGGADLRYYVYMPNGGLLYSLEAADNARHFYHYDESGNTVFLTDDNGSVSDSYGITPYGETVTQSGTTDNPFTFQGAMGVMQESGTGLYYARARYYDSASARFLSRDMAPSLHPLEVDPYQFALDNPVSFSDPTGLAAESTQTAQQTLAQAYAQIDAGKGYSAAPVYAAVYREGFQMLAFGLAFGSQYHIETGRAILFEPDKYIDFLDRRLWAMESTAQGDPEEAPTDFLSYLTLPEAPVGPGNVSLAVFTLLASGWFVAQRRRRSRQTCR